MFALVFGKIDLMLKKNLSFLLFPARGGATNSNSILTGVGLASDSLLAARAGRGRPSTLGRGLGAGASLGLTDWGSLSGPTANPAANSILIWDTCPHRAIVALLGLATVLVGGVSGGRSIGVLCRSLTSGHVVFVIS